MSEKQRMSWKYDKGYWCRSFPKIGWSVSIDADNFEVIEEVGSEEMIHTAGSLAEAKLWVLDKAYDRATRDMGTGYAIKYVHFSL